VSNARQAMPHGGKLHIETESVSVDQPRGTQHQPRSMVRLTVTDTGVGMDPETASHAFEPFFTTKPRGSGSGLGLSMVDGGIERAGGHASLRSEPGSGTSVCIDLPRAADGLAKASEPPPPPTEGLGALGVRVLVVEDEPLVRSVTRYYLE